MANNSAVDNDLNRDDELHGTTGTGLTAGETEPATAHDVGIGGGIGAVGGAVVGALAGGPIGAVIGAIVGGAASAGAVDVVDKHDHDYAQTAHTGDTATLGSTGTATGYTTGTTGYTTGTTGYAADTTPTTGAYAATAAPADALDVDAAQRLQLREEELSASTREVQAGEVRVHKDIITETKSIDVPVTREEVVIERHPVSGTATAANFSQTEQEIRIPVMEEQVTLEKTAVVTEEVEIGKRRVTETEHLTGTVQHEELRVDDTAGLRATTALEDDTVR